MPRQPFLPKYKGEHYCFDGRGLLNHDKAAAIIGRIIAEWSRAEHQMAMIMASLLGPTPVAGVALFATLRNARAQRDAITAVADSTLTGPLRLLLSACLVTYASVQKQRNDIAHGVIGWLFESPAVVVWIDSRDMALYDSEAWFRFTQDPYKPETHNHDELEKRLIIYEISDLHQILNEIIRTTQDIGALYAVIRHQNEGITSPEYMKLLSQPHIAREISRLQQGAKNVQ